MEDYKPDSPDCYPVFKVGSNNLEKECLICCENFKYDDEVLALPCIHLFHTNCISEWFKERNTCPTCKEVWFKKRDDKTFESITNRFAECTI